MVGRKTGAIRSAGPRETFVTEQLPQGIFPRYPASGTNRVIDDGEGIGIVDVRGDHTVVVDRRTRMVIPGVSTGVVVEPSAVTTPSMHLYRYNEPGSTPLPSNSPT